MKLQQQKDSIARYFIWCDTTTTTNDFVFAFFLVNYSTSWLPVILKWIWLHQIQFAWDKNRSRLFRLSVFQERRLIKIIHI